MKAYADAVSGMDAGAVSASIIAAQALAELQASLPHVGGVMNFFTGGNDLGLFAEGILSFGEAMNSYGNAVSGHRCRGGIRLRYCGSGAVPAPGVPPQCRRHHGILHRRE